MPTKKKPAASTRPLLQWGMALLGAVITLTAIGIVVWEALQPTAPPALSARIVAVDVTAAGQVATVRVQNDGDDTAAAQGHFVHVYVDRASGKPVALPEALRRAVEALVVT